MFRTNYSALWITLSTAIHVAAAAALVYSAQPQKLATPDVIYVDISKPHLAAPAHAHTKGKKIGERGRASKEKSTQTKRILDKEKNLFVPIRRSRQTMENIHTLVLEKSFRQNKTSKALKDRTKLSLKEARLIAALEQSTPLTYQPSDTAKRAEARFKKRKHARRKFAQARKAEYERMTKRLQQLNTYANARSGLTKKTSKGSGANAYGLSFYLAGKKRLGNYTVYPPQPISFPKSSCKKKKLSAKMTTLRMLVDRAGRSSIVYVKKESGDKGFDRCALKFAKKILFRPGEDEGGHPLNVWIHLKVEGELKL